MRSPDHPACKASCEHYDGATGHCRALALEGFGALLSAKAVPCRGGIDRRLTDLARTITTRVGRRAHGDHEDVRQELILVLVRTTPREPTLGSVLNGVAPSASVSAVREALGVRLEARRCSSCAWLGDFEDRGDKRCGGPRSRRWGNVVYWQRPLSGSCRRGGARKSSRIDVCERTEKQGERGGTVRWVCRAEACENGGGEVGLDPSADETACGDHTFEEEVRLQSTSLEELTTHVAALSERDEGVGRVFQAIEALLNPEIPLNELVGDDTTLEALGARLRTLAPVLDESVIGHLLPVVRRLREERRRAQPGERPRRKA